MDLANITNFSSFDQALNLLSVLLSSDVVRRILNETAHFIILSPSCKVPCCAETVPKTKISVITRSSYKQKQLLQTKKKQITQGCSSLTSQPVVLPTTIGSSPTWRDSAFPGRQAEGRQKKNCTWISSPSAPQSTISSYCSFLCTTQKSKNGGSHQVFALSRTGVSLTHFQNWSKSG